MTPARRVTRDFEAAIVGGHSGGGRPAYQFSRTGQHQHAEGLVVQVRSGTMQDWTGNFQRGDGTLDAIYETPSADHLCVVAGGTGYWVSVRTPELCEVIGVYPIREVREISEAALLVFVSFTDLAAYGAKGSVWRTSRVSWDGITILEASAQQIRGVAWDAPAEREVGFVVDPRTGFLEGGASPPE